MRVRIIVSDTGRGLRRDAELLSDQIREAGMVPETIVCPPRNERRARLIGRVDRFKRRIPAGLRYAINRLQCLLYRAPQPRDLALTIHLQRIHSRYIAGSHENWLIPNAEWYAPTRVQYLPLVDRVLCKTQESLETFRELHPRAEFLGFSGLLPERVTTDDSPERFRRFLHVAGNNRKKGTVVLVNLWATHPEWPMLDLVIDDRSRLPTNAPNVRGHEHADEALMAKLRAECGIALAPSEAEGFGHVLLDAMAHRQVVVTVDAPPMNELVAPERGWLVDWEGSRPCLLGRRYFVQPAALEAVIEELLASRPGALMDKANLGREWTLDNHAGFCQRFREQLERVGSND
ncbi:hypothetical protein CK501_06470 [Halovibrio salipaludis]|uniref:Glycosyl transferase family 1 domain-containing protein n=1 Tax=Halovibrio salipaludis TaxID=2032626 RepID=A0A2A2F996_9GAMM|nr:glycosyltransferase [Halovibrio salipaludis]PAU81199.1 hypothetical protein CK501_06470 [Halovibrio salipaludis]